MIEPINQKLNVINNVQGFGAQNSGYETNKYIGDVFKDFYFSNPTALPPKGRLVKDHKIKNNIFKEYYHTAKNFYNALQGKGGDYEVGRLNDSAVKLGSLSIAALLASKATSPINKAMEFVGFGTWFLAMSLWPKLFVGAPVKALTGVDINQEYIDSQGRRKRFYEDPQYLPWDLMSDEQINNAGKKLGIPNGVPNRRELIQDKMKQVAIQANTLWMLTAGFSTPILSSVIADRVKTPVRKAWNIINTGIAKVSLKSTRRPKSFINGFMNLFSDHSLGSENKLQKLLASGDSKEINKFFNKLSLKFTSNDVRNSITEKIQDLSKDQINKNGVLGFYKQLKDLFKVEKALLSYNKVALVDGIGNSWLANSKDILKSLKMSNDTVKKLAESNVDKRAEIIAQHLNSIPSYELNNVASKVTRIASRPVKMAEKSNKVLESFLSKSYEKLLSKILPEDRAQNVTKELGHKFEDRLRDIDSSFRGVAHVIENAKNKDITTLTKLIGGIKSPDAWTEFSELLTRGGEEALRGRLTESIKNKKVIDDIVDVIKRQDKSQLKRLTKWLGQSPQDLLADAARETVAHNNWIKKVGLVGGGVLLGATILTILNMGKANRYNPTIPASKEI